MTGCTVRLKINEGRDSRQLVEQGSGVPQIRRVEAFREPAVNRREEFACLLALALIAPQSRQADGRAHLPGFRLLAACDLEWDDACLNFHATAGVVKTASYYQVRQPMYTRSVGVWEKYREFLAPLLDTLEPE